MDELWAMQCCDGCALTVYDGADAALDEARRHSKGHHRVILFSPGTFELPNPCSIVGITFDGVNPERPTP